MIGGASSGAHLAMLYAYSRGDKSPLPISFVVDAVGPVDIKPDNWKRFSSMSSEEYETALNNGLGYTAIENERAAGHLAPLKVSDGSSDPYDWNDYQTMRIANGMCGIPNSLAAIEATTDVIYIHESCVFSDVSSSLGWKVWLALCSYHLTCSLCFLTTVKSLF